MWACALGLLVAILPPGKPGAAGHCDTTPTGGELVRVRMSAWPLPQFDGNADRAERMLVRSYELYVPDGLPDAHVPLVVSLHGNSGSGANHGARSGWTQHADAHTFIAVFPNGTGPGLPQVGTSWRAAEGSADVGYIRDVVEDVSSRYCVDASRIFVSGHSNGANLAQRLACDAEDVFASAAWYAGGEPNGGCQLSRGVGVASFHGTADETIPIATAEASRDAWVQRLGCTTTATSQLADGVEVTYDQCRDGVQVRWRTYTGQEHSWPESPRRDDLIGRMWAHFASHPRT